MAVKPLQLRTQDLPGAGNPTVLQNLNSFFQQVQQGFSNGLTLSQNFNASFVTQTVTTTALWSLQAVFTNSWGNFSGQPVKWTKLASGLVVMEGGIAGGSLSSAAFTMGYPPDQQLNIAQESNGSFGRITISSAGVVTPFGGSSTFVSVNATFMAADPTPTVNLTTPLTFQHGLSGRCTDLLCTNAQSADGTLAPPFAPNWVDNGDGTVTVVAAPGLAFGKTYTLRLLCLGEPA